MKRRNLDSLLFKPELKSLAGGKSWSTLVFLVIIYSVALFSLGVGKQIKSFLTEQMEDPFVKLISTVIPENECRREQLLRNDELQQNFEIDDARLFHRNFVSVQGVRDRVTLSVGSFDGKDHPLWDMLQSKPELFLTPFERCMPFNPLTQSGVILSEKAIRNLGYSSSNPENFPRFINWYNYHGVSTPAELPLLAVVKSLPLDIDIAIRDHTWGFLYAAADGNYRKFETTAWFVPDHKLQLITSNDLPASADIATGTIFSSSSFGTGMSEIKAHGENISLLVVTDSSFANQLQPEFVLFSMGDLSKVRAFADTLKNNKAQFGCIPRQSSSNTLEIDLTDIESKENLSIFNGFALLLSAALVLISLILIVNYTGAVLRLHINKNKRNLGTLTAFGYPNKTIISLYLRITATILGGSFLISYLLVWPLGFFGFKAFLGVFGLSDALSDVSFAHIPIYYSLPLFVLLPLAVVAWRIQGQLKATPGDLVYDR
jgi:hypothetical protein